MAEVNEKQAAQVEQKRSVVLQEARIGLAEHRRRDWVVDAEEGTEISDVMDSAYWAYVAGQFTPMDRIEVRAETGEWIVELIVKAAGRNWARVHPALIHKLVETSSAPPTEAVKHRVEYKGPHRKFAVIRITDSAIIQDGFATKAEGEVWMANHESVVL